MAGQNGRERVVTVPAKMRANWRPAMFTLGNLYLDNHHTMSAHRGLSPIELLIYVTVANGNIQKLMRERAIPEEFASTAVLPREWVVPVSRNAIATATGLPRETVRRQVAKLIEGGFLIEDPRGGVTLPIGVIDTLQLEPLIDTLVTNFARAAETLFRCGVIEMVGVRQRLGDAI